MPAHVSFPNSLYAMVQRKSKEYAIEYIRRAARSAAAYAKANHPYQDHTYNLTKSIQAVPTANGAFLSARMPYAHFVEYGTVKNKAYPYLRPAIDYMVKLIKNKKNIGGTTFEKTLWQHTKLERASDP